MGVSKNRGTPKSSVLKSGFPLFSPSVLGYHYLWKHPDEPEKTQINIRYRKHK